MFFLGNNDDEHDDDNYDYNNNINKDKGNHKKYNENIYWKKIHVSLLLSAHKINVFTYAGYS